MRVNGKRIVKRMNQYGLSRRSGFDNKGISVGMKGLINHSHAFVSYICYLKYYVRT
jgi:hypothetical protein